MSAHQLSAQFAAYIWYLHQTRDDQRPTAEAHVFAQQYWKMFLPIAPRGFGRLLLKMARQRQRQTACR